MNFYEVVFIVKPEASAAHVELVTQRYITVIKEGGGDISKTEFCGLHYFAYPIKKNKRGHYILLNVACKGEVVKELEHQFNLDEDILRSLIVKVERLDNNPSSLMKRSYRDNNPAVATAATTKQQQQYEGE